MRPFRSNPFLLFIFALSVTAYACGGALAEPTATSTPNPTATQTLVPTATATATNTPRPTRTPNLAATQKAEDILAEAQEYVELGYLSSAEGNFKEYDDFREEWAQLGWYQRWHFSDQAQNFTLSAHLKWSSAYRNADISGCGFVFAAQENGDHYAVFLDRTQVLMLYADLAAGFSRRVGVTSGTGRVKFDNPADQPVEADFTLIVNDGIAYVLIDDEMIGKYTLSQSKNLNGNLGLTLLSGTNKDFGTRCEMTDIHAFFPND
ncbi:MAG TPA: hypothetical protein PKE62_16595 [Anaerolineales bacterium]|nr:hypothetical protein [Anaerolineales bacterium]